MWGGDGRIHEEDCCLILKTGLDYIRNAAGIWQRNRIVGEKLHPHYVHCLKAEKCSSVTDWQ